MSEPLTKQRSKYVEVNSPMPGARAFQRRVGDGTLVCFVAEEPHGWHLSISFTDAKGRASRYPRWDEIVHARETHLPDDVGFVMHLPASEEYVAMHDTTFHLHQHPPRTQ